MKTLLVITILTAGAMYAQTTRADREFLKSAMEGGLAEVKFGQLAQEKGNIATVKRFADRMVADHTRLDDQMKSLAATKNIDLPTSVSIKDEASYKMLEVRGADSFDKAYIQDMIKDHRDDIAAFRKEADSGSDPDIKAWASQALPILREHLRLAENAAKELGISTSTSGGMR